MRLKGIFLGVVALSGLSACGGGGDATPTVTYVIQAADVNGGSISPASVNVAQGQSVSFSLTPDVGFTLQSVTGCGGTLTGNTYRTGPITANCSIAATFTKNSYLVSAIATTGGNVSPNQISVLHGETTDFDITIEDGYELSSITGCGGSLADSRYTTAAITQACEISARFSLQTFTVRAAAEGKGSISPAQQLANYNQQLSFTLAPEEGYMVSNVTGCGGTLQQNTYLTAPITAVCEVNASFSAATFAITAASAGGGSISPNQINVKKGGQAEFTIQPDSGFRLKQIDGCAGRFTDNKYIVEEVSADCSVIAQFNRADEVEFADEQLARVVKLALGIPFEQPIMASRLNQLTTLIAGELGITRLDGLQYATSLRVLDLSSNKITNFTPLSLLAADKPVAQLNSLYIGNNPTQLLPDFSRLALLQNLSIQGSELEALPSFAELDKLSYLSLAYNKLSDISALAGLPLSNLYLSGNPLADSAFDVITGMPLQSLHLDNTEFTSAQRLATLRNLSDLSANYTPLSNLTPLVGLTDLRTLSIYGTQVIDLTPLLNMFPQNSAAVYLGGCLKTQGFARAPQLIEQLRNRGIFVQVYDWAIPYNTGCVSGDDIITDLALTGSMNEQGLRLNWSLNSTDTGPWRCELHYDLGVQQPRAPVRVLENCHNVRSWTLPGVTEEPVEPHLIIDTGLVRTVFKADAGRVVPASGLPDPYLDSSDWLQIVAKTNPYLVPYRAAKLRLHLLSPTNKTPPQLNAWIQQGANRTPLAVKAPLRLPAQKRLDSLSESYLIDLPANMAKPGIELVVSIAGQNERVFKPQFAEINSIDLTLVPFKLGELTTSLPENSLVENSILTVWPFASVNINRRQPFSLSTAANQNTTSSMLRELFDLRIAERGTSYYYGYFTREMNTDNWGGMAYRPGTSGVGLLPFGEIDFVLSHELGHNLSIQHAPCGDASGVDTNYPYDNASIGTYGVALSFNSLLSPAVFKDLMSYCHSKHISDYNLELAQDYISAQRNSAALHLRTTAAAKTETAAMSMSSLAIAEQPTMFYRLQLHDKEVPSVVQAMQISYLPEFVANSGFRVLVEYSAGMPQLMPVEMLQFGHGDETQQISFAVPMQHQGSDVIAWTLFEGSRILHKEQIQTPVTTANSAMAVPAVRITEQAGEVCVAHTGRFDAINLLLKHQQGVSVVALNERNAEFCRDTADLPADGQWQVQTRIGYQVNRVEQRR